jgi:hypothetical protein
LALVSAGEGVLGASAFLGGSSFFGFSFSMGGGGLTALGVSLTASFLGGSFSTTFFLTAISAGSSFTTVLS